MYDHVELVKLAFTIGHSLLNQGEANVGEADALFGACAASGSQNDCQGPAQPRDALLRNLEIVPWIQTPTVNDLAKRQRL